MNEEKQREAVEEIVGSLSPKPKEVYYEAAHGIFDKMTMNRFVTPYLLRELFTPLEMEMVLAMPATGEELAEKFGMETEKTKEMLLDITEDGVIDEWEIPALKKILENLDELERVAQSLKIWVKKNL